MYYKVCDYCGAWLDSGETCDCEKSRANNNKITAEPEPEIEAEKKREPAQG